MNPNTIATNQAATEREPSVFGESPDPHAHADVPIGDTPPLPRWPLGVFALGWAAWVAFLVWLWLSGPDGRAV
jgi:hypothetical protein